MISQYEHAVLMNNKWIISKIYEKFLVLSSTKNVLQKAMQNES